MIVHDCVQGTPEWLNLRLGIPTASRFDDILTPKTRKPSASARKYRAELLAEYLIRAPMDSPASPWMERGTALEPEARAWYAFETGADVRQVGFVTRDDRLVGGSPDSLIGEDGILEIKCPSATNHVLYMLNDDPGYIGQCQGLLYLTGRAWVDLLSYNPVLPPVVIRVERDEEYIADLCRVLDAFVEVLEADKARLAEHRAPELAGFVPEEAA